MPLVRIEIKKGKDPEYKKKLLGVVHQSIMEAIDIFIVIQDPPDENWGLAGHQRA